MGSKWLIVACIYLLYNVRLSESRPQDPVPTTVPSIPSQTPVIILQTSSFRPEHSTELDSTEASTEDSQLRQNKAASIRDSIKVVANQLLDSSNVTLDTRTPPKIKAQTKNPSDKPKTDIVENSHAGVAVPLDDEELDNKIIIHRNHNKVTPTTDSGLSTWILLSGKPTTPKPSDAIKTNKTEKVRINNKTQVRKSTTEAPVTETFLRNSTMKTVSKVKASVLANMKEKTSTARPTTVKPTDVSNLPLEAKDGDLDLSTEVTKKNGSTKKPPRTTTVAPKRKKNKNRRRKPATKTSNGTKIATGKPQLKEKPISTQVYNYISREVLPTVGVGLVGLVVTAGLASYFLYPFAGPVRRNYELADRKDDKYYYNEGDYSYGGQSEEDVISKVIAGMPATSAGLQDYAYAKPSTENRYRNTETQNVRYRQSNGVNYPTYSASYSQDKVSYSNQPSPPENTYYKTDYSTANYGSDVIMEQQKETGYTVAAIGGNEINSQKFVVGNIPKDVTPAAVPEHGPRSLKLRRRRNIMKKSIDDNEITDDVSTVKYIFDSTTPRIEAADLSEVSMNTTKHDEKLPSFPDFVSQNIPTDLISSQISQIPIIPILKNMLIMKAEMGLMLLQHMVSVGRYYVEMAKVMARNYYNNRYYVATNYSAPVPTNYSAPSNYTGPY